MPYTLVSAATLGFDLVRLPAGRAVAGVLLAALQADDAALGPAGRRPPRPRPWSASGEPVLAVRSRRARELGRRACRSVRTAAAGAAAR